MIIAFRAQCDFSTFYANRHEQDFLTSFSGIGTVYAFSVFSGPEWSNYCIENTCLSYCVEFYDLSLSSRNRAAWHQLFFHSMPSIISDYDFQSFPHCLMGFTPPHYCGRMP